MQKFSLVVNIYIDWFAKTMSRVPLKRNDDFSLCTRAAWLHYAGGLTQAAVAKRLGVSSITAHRLITLANQKGLVKVTVDGDIAECVALEMQLSDIFDLLYCEVVPDLNEEELPLRTLGFAGSRYLMKEISSGRNDLIGLGHGRTISFCVSQMPHTAANGTAFVSLLGGLTRNFAANPHDVMHRLAECTGAEAYVMPVPFFANSVEDRDVILSQPGVGNVMQMAAQSKLKIVGIGSVGSEAHLVASGMIEGKEIQQVMEQGAVGELLGHFFTQEGGALETALTKRTLAINLNDMKNSRIVAIAGGVAKTHAIGSILMSGLLSGLITDERTAKALVNNQKTNLETSEELKCMIKRKT